MHNRNETLAIELYYDLMSLTSEKCNQPPPITNGMATDDGLTATYTCDEGYSIDGYPVINCVNGVWEDNPDIKCERKLHK